MDERGVVIDEYGPAYADLDLPIIDGLAAPPGDGGPLIDERARRSRRACIGVARAQPDLSGGVSQIDVATRTTRR